MNKTHLTLLFTIFSLFTLKSQNDIKVYEDFDLFKKDILVKPKNDTVYIVNFWATWCAPCVAELPYFQAFHEEFKDQKIQMVLVSMDMKRQIDKRVKPFLKKRNITPTVVLLAAGRPNDWIDEVSPEWSGAIPITLFIQGDNQKFYEKEYHSKDELIVDYQSFLNRN